MNTMHGRMQEKMIAAARSLIAGSVEGISRITSYAKEFCLINPRKEQLRFVSIFIRTALLLCFFLFASFSRRSFPSLSRLASKHVGI